MEEGWHSLDLNLFQEAQDALSNDVIDGFPEIHSIMFDYQVAPMRLILEGITDFSQFNFPTKLPQNKIVSLMTYLFDEQMKIINGESDGASILTCAYIHKDFAITDINLARALQRFIEPLCLLTDLISENTLYHSSLLSVIPLKQYMHPSYHNSYTDDYYHIEISLTNFLKDPQRYYIRGFSEGLSSISSNIPDPIAFLPFIFLTGPVAKQLTYCVPDRSDYHEHAQKIAKDFASDSNKMVDLVQEIKYIMPPKNYQDDHYGYISSIINKLVDGGDCLKFRILRVLMYQNITKFIKLEDLLKTELTKFGISQNFQQKDFKELTIFFQSAFELVLKVLCLEPELFYDQMIAKGLKSWFNFQDNGCKLFLQSQQLKIQVKCKSPEHQQSYKLWFVYWTLSISTQLVYKTITTGLKLKIYKPRELPIIYSLLEFCCVNCFSSADSLRTVQAIAFIKKSDNKNKAPIPPSEIEKNKPLQSSHIKLMNLFAHVFLSLTLGLTYLQRADAFDYDEDDFNEEETYNERIKILNGLPSLTPQTYEEYKEFLNKDQKALKSMALLNASEAKELASSLLDAIDGNECDIILQSLISFTITLNGFKPGQKVKISLDRSPIYPSFLFVTQPK